MKKYLVGLLVGLLAVGGLMAGCSEQVRDTIEDILKVDARTPALNATGVNYANDLTLTFNYPIAWDLCISDLFASYGPGHAAGTPDIASATLEASGDRKTITISGIGGWSNLTSGAGPKAVEILAAEEKIKDIFENKVSAGKILWKFTLSGRGVASVYPADKEIDVAPDAQIKVIFSEDMDASTLNADTFTVSGSTVSGAVAYDADTKTAVFTPSGLLHNLKTYIASLSASVKSASGDPLRADYSWSFTVRDLTEAWTRTYNNSTYNSHDRGQAIAVDESGNVYVVGYETVTGQEENIWVRKYDRDGNEIWTKTYNGADNGWDIGLDITVDGSGNVYVIGTETVSGQGGNIWIRKYDGDGGELWTRTYNDADNDWDNGSDIAVDGNGNVYVVGYETVSGQGANAWVRKYDANGNALWTRTHNGPANSSDVGNGITVDGSGNVYVAGYERVSGEESNVWVRKYDADGNVVWTQTYNGVDNDRDIGLDVAVDGSGNVFVIGYETVTGQDKNIWIRKYDGDGNEIWTKTHDGPANGWDSGQGIAVDGSGSVYVTGFETVSGQLANVWVRKYDGDGNEIWTKTYNNDAENGWEVGYGIVVDENGNVYVAGYENASSQATDVWVRKYQP